jgi:hypothetical protein
MQKRAYLILSLCLLSGAVAMSTAAVGGTPRPEGARAYIISPAHGETVAPTFMVRFGLKGMGVAPAGCDMPNTGHHHLLIDNDQLPPPDEPMTEDIQHFGGGQTQAKVSLPPGEHTLLLILGDKDHIPHSPPVMSEQITVTVEE